MKPLIQEVKIKDQLHERLISSLKLKDQHFKMMNAVVRLPLMVEQFQRALRRKETSEQSKQYQKDAVNIMRTNNVTEETQESFFDHFIVSLDKVSDSRKKEIVSQQYQTDNPDIYTHDLNLDHYERIRRKIEDGMIQPSEMSQSNSPVSNRRHQSGKNVSSFTGLAPIEIKSSEVASGSIALRQRAYDHQKKQRRAPQYKSSTMTVSNNFYGKFSSNDIILEEDSFV